MTALDERIGLTTAYGYAKLKGYTGTEEQFAQALANAGITLEQIETAIDGFVNTTVPNAVQSVEDKGTEQIGLIQTEGTTQKNAVTAEGTTQKNAVTAEGTTQKNAVNSAGSTQVNAVNSAGSTQVGNVNTAGSTQVGAVQAKGQEVIASIPQDYSELTAEVDDLKSATSQITEKLELVEVPASANKWDAESVQVGMVHTNGQTYTGGIYDNYRYYDIGYVPAGSVITCYAFNNIVLANMDRVVFFDENGTVMSSDSKSGSNNVTVPTGAARVYITISQSIKNTAMILIDVESAPTEYIPYAEGYSYYIATDDFIPTDYADGFVQRDGSKQVTAKNAEFMFYSPNLIDESALIDGYFVNQTNGQLSENASHMVTDWIEVEGGQVYALSSLLDRAWRYCFYDSSKTYISGEYINSTSATALTAPSNAKYFRCSTTEFRRGSAQFEKGSKTQYSAYGTAYLMEQYAPRGANAIINLPSKIYALTGYELNIYFENLTEDWTRYAWNVDCSKGMQLERGYRVTPTDSDTGSYTLTIKATDSTGTVATATTTLIITASTAGSGVTDTLIVLGDSTTNNGIAVTKLAQNFADDVMSLTLYGTRGTAPYKHEGRSGWTFNAYFNPPNAGDIALGVENPWYNPTTETFDASYYFANSGVSIPNWFFINLGINDTFNYATDASLESAITTIKGLCDAMIASLKSAAPNMKIGLCLTIPPNHSQDAFGKAYNCSQTRDRYKRNNVLWVNDLIETYDGRESENLYLIPIYTNLDTVYNMGFETLPVNARNTAITYESPIGNGGVHPVESGYWQIADVYTAFLKAQA